MLGQSYTVLRVFGLDIKVNVGWAFIAILIAWSLAQGYFPGLYEGLPRQTYWWMGLAGAIGLFASIVVHELAHALVARLFGMKIRGITLWLLGGAAELADEPPSPKAEFFMAIVGPLTSAMLAIALLQTAKLLTSSDAPDSVTGVLSYLGLLNGILAIFNLVPAFPLDGGRVQVDALGLDEGPALGHMVGLEDWFHPGPCRDRFWFAHDDLRQHRAGPLVDPVGHVRSICRGLLVLPARSRTNPGGQDRQQLNDL